MKTKILLSLFFVLILSGCNVGRRDTNINDLLKIQSTDPEKAEQLALAGEKWVYGAGFMHAHELFDKALALDPNNVRARFYKSYTSVHMTFKGILKRVEPVVARLTLAQQEEFARFIRKFPEGDLKNFLLNGNADISSEKDIQAFIGTVQQALRNLRVTAQSLSDQSLTLHVTQGEMVDMRSYTGLASLAERCVVTKTSEASFKEENCDAPTYNFNMNYADWGAVRLLAAGYQVYLGLGTAYDLTGLEAALKMLNATKRPTDKYVISVLKMQPTLGTLVNSSALKDVLTTGVEGIEAVKLALSKQSELCPNGYPMLSNRPGYLFSHGFCVSRETENLIPIWQASLNGPVPVTYYGNYHSKPYTTMVDMTKPLNGSIVDLKALLPTAFDKCENAINLGDNSLGGMYPNNDYVIVARQSNPAFLQPYCRR